MRIISGKHKGKRLIAPKNLPVRPTTDRAKEALFNILNFQLDFQEISLLDLFSGTGNIAYEFASRGTQNITAVDQHFGCVKFINKTSEELGLQINTVKSEVYKYLEKVNTGFDIIFADPPYNFTKEDCSKLLNLIIENKRLNTNGLFILEHSKQITLQNLPYFEEERKYGSSVFSFFRN